MPRLIVPSNGGGTKLTRTLLAGEAAGVCTGAGGAVMVSSGDIKRAGDSSGVAEAIGFGDSCAVAIPMASHAAAIHDPQAGWRSLCACAQLRSSARPRLADADKSKRCLHRATPRDGRSRPKLKLRVQRSAVWNGSPDIRSAW